MGQLDPYYEKHVTKLEDVLLDLVRAVAGTGLITGISPGIRDVEMLAKDEWLRGRDEWSAKLFVLYSMSPDSRQFPDLVGSSATGAL